VSLLLVDDDNGSTDTRHSQNLSHRGGQIRRMFNRLYCENEVEGLGWIWHQLHGTPNGRGALRKVL
jgi:hypothetical protein